MRIAISIETEHNPILLTGVGNFNSRIRIPAVDLSEHSFHFRIAEFILGIPPIERVQRCVDGIV
jgi:hypothetical protein